MKLVIAWIIAGVLSRLILNGFGDMPSAFNLAWSARLNAVNALRLAWSAR